MFKANQGKSMHCSQAIALHHYNTLENLGRFYQGEKSIYNVAYKGNIFWVSPGGYKIHTKDIVRKLFIEHNQPTSKYRLYANVGICILLAIRCYIVQSIWEISILGRIGTPIIQYPYTT